MATSGLLNLPKSPSRSDSFSDRKLKCCMLCVHVHVNWLKGGVAMGVAYHKKVHNFDIDAQICTNVVERLVTTQITSE